MPKMKPGYAKRTDCIARCGSCKESQWHQVDVNGDLKQYTCIKCGEYFVLNIKTWKWEIPPSEVF